MSKAQSLIVQFVLFFVTGFTIFLVISNYFKYQSDIFRERMLTSDVELANSYISSGAITLISGCKQCDKSRININFPSSATGYNYDISLKDSINVSVISREDKNYVSSLHNLNYTIEMTGDSNSIGTISLTFEKTKNKLTGG